MPRGWLRICLKTGMHVTTVITRPIAMTMSHIT